MTARVVLFSGGRGSGVLSQQLLKDPRVQLTLAINGYDDGASTGEVRRFLGDSLGPSDFRKNASRLALELGVCAPSLVELLDTRLPKDIDQGEAPRTLRRLAASMPPVAERIEAFLQEQTATGRSFAYGDCAVGNIVFAGSFLLNRRRFNDAVDDYAALVGLPPGMIEDVTGGENAHLVAIGEDGDVLASEEEIVNTDEHHRIREIFLIDRALTEEDRGRLAPMSAEQKVAFFDGLRVRVTLNPRLAEHLAAADLIVYAPGTQHSSLFPSYLTPGLSDVIARNLGAVKLFITNIQRDAEIAGSSAVDIIGRALYYLNDRGRRQLPTPCLITHYVVNDPGRVEASQPYVPLGQIETFEDPRLIRISNYEDGVTGRHDAAKILEPFVRSLVDVRKRQRLAVLLHDAGSVSKVTQTLIEMVRGGTAAMNVEVTVYHEGDALDRSFVASLPFAVRPVDGTRPFREVVGDRRFDYVMLVESSGMYRGEDVAVLASHLAIGRLDAVWGSRRLSLRDVQESIRFVYSKTPLAGVISSAGSHLLSLACLVLYGRYVSDTLSAFRAVRADDALSLDVPLSHKRANHYLLARLLGRKAEILEIPVRFFPISPERVRRTTIWEGVRALAILVGGRFGVKRTRGTGPEVASQAAPEAERQLRT